MTAAKGHLEASGLTAGYGQTQIIDGVSLSAPAGSRIALLGRNGVGKTTTLATLVGQTRRHAGTLTLDGIDLTALSASRRAELGLGYVPQTRDIFRSLSVEENLVAGLKGRPRADLEEAYALFPRLKERRLNGGGALSGGEQQMLSVARALLGRPSVLLLDEPLEGLAPVICDQLMQVLTTLKMTIILVEQQIDRALEFAEQVIFLERGRVMHQGSVADVSADPALMERFLGVDLIQSVA